MTNYRLITLFILGAAGLIVCGGCRPGAERPAAVVLSGDVQGWIAPCNCTTNQSGGLARRATYVNQLREEADVVLVDVGGSVIGTSPYDRAKFEAILRGEAILKTAVHNIGKAEAKLGPKYLRKTAKEIGVNFLSANALDRDGQLVADPIRIVEAGGRKIALIGVLSQKYATDKIDVSPPDRAVLDAIRNAPKSIDAVIVLAYMPENELRNFAATLPEVDAVVGGPTGQPIPPKFIGPTLLTSATNEGKFLVRLDAPAPDVKGRWRGSVVELTEDFADDRRQVDNLLAFRERLKKADFTPPQTSFIGTLRGKMPGEFAVAGTKACLSCHADDNPVWAASRHAHAWESLKDQTAFVDPDCQRCHTTGYGQLGGFVAVGCTPDRINVGCESCHGPSKAHAANEKVHTGFYGQARNHCIDCHDRENSPKFDFDEYWKKIEHGTEESKTESESKASSNE